MALMFLLIKFRMKKLEEADTISDSLLSGCSNLGS